MKIEFVNIYQSIDRMWPNCRETVEKFAENFCISEIEPFVNDSHRRANAYDYFAAYFCSGILLGQINDYLILREYYRDQGRL